MAGAADAIAGESLYNDFCIACHAPAIGNKGNVLVGANNPAAIAIQMQQPASPMGYLLDVLTSADIADIAAYLGQVLGLGPRTVTLVEYHHAGFDHYFVTGIAAEIAALDAGTIAGWQRTGATLAAFADPDAGTSPVCRFFSATFAPKSSHFYTPFPVECAKLKASSDWTFEAEAFRMALPDASGACPVSTVPVYRLYNGGQGGAPNHRYTTDLAVRAQMTAKGWVAEGLGDLAVTMCAPA